MRNILTFFIAILLICGSCKKEVNPGFKDSVRISSRKYFSTLYYVKGYSFEKNKSVDVILMSEDADIAPVDSINLAGSIVGMKLSVLSNNPYGFYLNARHANLSDAQNFFNNYKTAVFPSSTTLTDALKIYDVYTMRTSKNNYVKFLITNLRQISDYFEADISYVIQRDGSDLFPE